MIFSHLLYLLLYLIYLFANCLPFLPFVPLFLYLFAYQYRLVSKC